MSLKIIGKQGRIVTKYFVTIYTWIYKAVYMGEGILGRASTEEMKFNDNTIGSVWELNRCFTY